MSDPSAFAEFVRRIRAGDAQAAEELVRNYEPLIRRTIRLKMEDRQLGRVFDSLDVCQSVLKSFFVRTAAGQYDLDEPTQLVRLLVTMARNKLASEVRREHQQRRDQRRADAGEALDGVAAADPTPSRVLAGRDLLAEVRGRLTANERNLADLRAEGLTWDQIADRAGGTAQARRVQLARALDRVAGELGLDDGEPGA